MLKFMLLMCLTLFTFGCNDNQNHVHHQDTERTERQVCPMCAGVGFLATRRICPICLGQGRIEKDSTYSH